MEIAMLREAHEAALAAKIEAARRDNGLIARAPDGTVAFVEPEAQAMREWAMMNVWMPNGRIG
jgi:hypothetical protein